MAKGTIKELLEISIIKQQEQFMESFYISQEFCKVWWDFRSLFRKKTKRLGELNEERSRWNDVNRYSWYRIQTVLHGGKQTNKRFSVIQRIAVWLHSELPKNRRLNGISKFPRMNTRLLKKIYDMKYKGMEIAIVDRWRYRFPRSFVFILVSLEWSV